MLTLVSSKLYIFEKTPIWNTTYLNKLKTIWKCSFIDWKYCKELLLKFILSKFKYSDKSKGFYLNFKSVLCGIFTMDRSLPLAVLICFYLCSPSQEECSPLSRIFVRCNDLKRVRNRNNSSLVNSYGNWYAHEILWYEHFAKVHFILNPPLTFKPQGRLAKAVYNLN